jgi:hypothetical protein
VGEPGSEEHAAREAMLKAAVGLRARATSAQDRFSLLVTRLDAESAPAAAQQQACTALSAMQCCMLRGLWLRAAHCNH